MKKAPIVVLLFLVTLGLACQEPTPREADPAVLADTQADPAVEPAPPAPAPAPKMVLPPARIGLEHPTVFFQSKNSLSLGDSSLGWQVESVQATGGTIIQTNDPFLVHLTPEARSVTVTTWLRHPDQEEVIPINQHLEVVAVPLPQIEITMAGRAVNVLQGIRSNQLASLSARVMPDADFARLHPEDARYQVTDWQATLATGPRPKSEPIRATGTGMNLSSFRQIARAGDRLVIEVKKVVRRNWQGERKEVRMIFPPLSIPIN
ncbi:MAG: hypothetical protein D6722_04895 [Bacteroidetes bacterium]|nr:MAG: hypothetical protein D6722_04895 [Bacteroidota bacterium]